MQAESIEQEMVVQYCDFKGIPIYAIPNGGKRNAKEAYYMKRSGVKAGVPDLCIPVAKGVYHGLYIELKVGKNKPTTAQLGWLALLAANGYKTAVCYGFNEARKVIDQYLQRG